MNNEPTQEEKILKKTQLVKSVELILNKLGIENKWKQIAGGVIPYFKDRYPEQSADDLEKLADLIKKNTTYKDRFNFEFLEELLQAVSSLEKVKKMPSYTLSENEKNDEIAVLCYNYISNFSEKNSA